VEIPLPLQGNYGWSYLVKILKRALRTAGWAAFLLGSALSVLVLFEKPRSLAEFHAFIIQIDTLYFLLALIGSCVVATIISILGQQEG
jgi:hypothetical protein